MNIEFNNDTQDRILRIVKLLNDSITCTLGPSGKLVLLNKPYVGSCLTKDGVSISRQIAVADPLDNQIIAIVKSACEKTVDLVGDGTTTTIALLHAIVSEGIKLVRAGYDSQSIKRGIDKAIAVLTEELKSSSVSIDIKTDAGKKRLEQIATISANGDTEIGALVAKLLADIGEHGSISVEEATGQQGISYKKSVGFDLNAGLVSPYFVNNIEQQKAIYEDCYVLLSQEAIVSGEDLKRMIPVLQFAAEQGKPILILAKGFDGEALSSLVKNKMEGKLKVVCVRPQAIEQAFTFEDLAVATGAKLRLLGQDQLSGLVSADLGFVKKIEVSRNKTVMILEQTVGRANAIKEQASKIQVLLGQETNEYLKQRHKNRLARLLSGVAVIKVGGKTETEIKEKRDRVDDAVGASKASLELGIGVGRGKLFTKG